MVKSKEVLKINEQVQEVTKNVNFEALWVNQNTFKKDKQFKYIITIKDRKFDYFQGLGHMQKQTNYDKRMDIVKPLHPLLSDVLYCLLSDMSCIEYNDMDDFIAEFGYDENIDSVRKGEQIYRDIKENNKKLRSIFSNEQISKLNELLENY